MVSNVSDPISKSTGVAEGKEEKSADPKGGCEKGISSGRSLLVNLVWILWCFYPALISLKLYFLGF